MRTKTISSHASTFTITASVALLTLLGGCASKPPLAQPAAMAPAPAVASSSNSGQSAVAAVQAPVVDNLAPGPNVAKSAFFDFNSDALKPEDKPVVEANAQFLQSHANAHVQLQGNCDPRGSQEYNLALGQARAHAVMKAMELLGANASQMEAISYGSEKASTNRADYAHDRRVDIAYQQ